MKLFLVRHGETDYNAKRVFQGYGPIPLSDRGRRQAELVAGRLATLKPQVFYTSDVLRTHETAEIINKQLGLSIQLCEGLREWNVGVWEHKPVEAFDAHLEAIGAHLVTYELEGGESQLQTQERTVVLMEQFASQHAGDTILCVTHGKVIDLFARHVLGLDVMQTPAYSITNTSVSVFGWQDGVWDLQTLNEVHHLDALEG